MATRKKKSDVIEVNEQGDGWPKITEGSHLKVITYENGRTELIWDDEALMRDVRAALLKAESTVLVAEEKPKKTRKKKDA